MNIIEIWRKQDPKLSNKSGFLKFLGEQDLGLFNVGDTKVWLNYYHEAKKKRMTVAELLFEKQRKTLKLDISLPKKKKEPIEIFVIDEDKRKELNELDERLKLIDPARVKKIK